MTPQQPARLSELEIERLAAYFRRQGGQCNAQQPIVPVAGSELLKAADMLAALTPKAEEGLRMLFYDPVEMSVLTERLQAHVKFARDANLSKVTLFTNLLAEAVEAIAALTAPRSEVVGDDGWRDIESAPKDGTEILVWRDHATVPVVHLAWYRSEAEWLESGQYCGGWDTLEDWEGWWSYTRGSVTQEKLEGSTAPTHWMPYNPPEQQ